MDALRFWQLDRQVVLHPRGCTQLLGADAEVHRVMDDQAVGGELPPFGPQLTMSYVRA
jgi:hypothetical protein